ncbi:hypothetical protein BOX15_Mlig021367g3, partial [Macrostomum lignano]
RIMQQQQQPPPPLPLPRPHQPHHHHHHHQPMAQAQLPLMNPQALPQQMIHHQPTSNFCPCTHSGGGGNRLARNLNRTVASSSTSATAAAGDGNQAAAASSTTAAAVDAESTSDSTDSSADAATAETVRFVDENKAERMAKAFRSLYETKQFADVDISVGQVNFAAHKNILAMSSPFFMAMFSHSLRESVSNQVTLSDMEPATFELVLSYIYTGSVNLSLDSVQCLLSAANLLQLPSLKAACAEYMRRHVTKANCLPVYFFARLHDCHALAQLARTVIGSSFQEICSQDEFLSLPADRLAEIIRDDFLCVQSEEAVFEACLAWLARDPQARLSQAYDIMKYVRFACMSCYYLCDRVECEPMLQADSKVQELLRLARYHHMLPNRQAELDLNSTPRCGMSYVRGYLIVANPYSEDKTRKFNSVELLLPSVAGGVAGGDGYCHLQHQQPPQYHLVRIAKLPLSLYMPGVVVTGSNQLLLAGGTQKKISVRGSVTCDGVSNQLHSAQTDVSNSWTWQSLARMALPRTQFLFVLVDQAVYAVGGFTGQEVTDQVEKFCLQSLVWRPVAPLPQPLRCATGHAYRGRLYTFGGENARGEIVNVCYRYDPQSDSWSQLTSMQTPRALAGCAVHRDRLYVIGGNTAPSERWRKEILPEFCTDSVETFNPDSGAWEAGPSLPNLLCGAGVAKLSGCLRVIGGEDDKSWMAGECRLTDNRWEEAQLFHAAIMSTFGCAVASVSKELLKKCAPCGAGGAAGHKCPCYDPMMMPADEAAFSPREQSPRPAI